MNLVSLNISKGGGGGGGVPDQTIYDIIKSTSSNSPGKHNTVHLSVTMVTVTFNVGYKISTKEVPYLKEKENVSFRSFSFY